jgi:TolB protein
VAIALFEGSEDAGGDDPASVVASTLHADLAFEGVFELSMAAGVDVAGARGRPAPARLDLWRRTGADGLLAGAVRREDDELEVEVRLYELARGELAFARGARGPANDPRAVAHLLGHELLASQAGIRSVAMTRLAFVSNRAGSVREPTGYLRPVKEIYVSDYDGARQRRLTADGGLVLTPSWSPDGESIAYTAFRSGFQQILVARPGDGRAQTAPAGRGKNWLPAWSPDGQRLAFTSNRDGNEEIYVVGADGRGLARLTRSPAIDTSPAWSPDGARIAFTSSRTGSPQIWLMDADGANQRALTHERYCDRPTWSAEPYNEIAYVSRTKTGFDIKVIEVATGAERQLTFGQGFNESPAWAPSGRHLAFCSTRSGSQQIWTMTRTGEDLRQVTRVGANSMPAWSAR